VLLPNIPFEKMVQGVKSGRGCRRGKGPEEQGCNFVHICIILEKATRK
jgi:hypothetical protein